MSEKLTLELRDEPVDLYKKGGDGSAYQNFLIDMIISVLPYGTLPRYEVGETPEDLMLIDVDQHDYENWLEVPRFVADLFAVTAFILENSGALAHFTPYKPVTKRVYTALWVEPEEHGLAIATGKKWREMGEYELPLQLREWWKELISFAEYPFNYNAYKGADSEIYGGKNWWHYAFLLMIAADEAAEGVGMPESLSEESLREGTFNNIIHADAFERLEAAMISNGQLELRATICTYSTNADLVCVQPKSLFPSVGAGTRVFSRNLALLNPRGLVRTKWVLSPCSYVNPLHQGFNMLLIPVPFKMDRSNSEIIESRSPLYQEAGQAFKVKQTWLEDEEEYFKLKDEFKKIIEKALETDHVHAIVLPELALNRDTFEELADIAKKMCPTLEIFVSGTHQNCKGVTGNYVWTRIFVSDTDTDDDDIAVPYIDYSQSKHHRWKLTKGQVKSYGLESKMGKGLPPNCNYWESFNTRARELGCIPFRNRSVLTSIICEDLARSEPCHETLRSVGPNLLIALLMDGPQIEQRWGVRHASNFVEDHGCAVLTLTSRGLVERANKVFQKTQKAVENTDEGKKYRVGYFRDSNTEQGEPLELAENEKAILLRLVTHTVDGNNELPKRRTIDGRASEVLNWIMADTDGVTPIAID